MLIRERLYCLSHYKAVITCQKNKRTCKNYVDCLDAHFCGKKCSCSLTAYSYSCANTKYCDVLRPTDGVLLTPCGENDSMKNY